MLPPVSRVSRQGRGGRRGRWRQHVTVAAALILLAQFALVSAHAQSTLLNRARALMADGNPQGAYELLTPHEPNLAGDPGSMTMQNEHCK